MHPISLQADTRRRNNAKVTKEVEDPWVLEARVRSSIKS